MKNFQSKVGFLAPVDALRMDAQVHNPESETMQGACVKRSPSHGSALRPSSCRFRSLLALIALGCGFHVQAALPNMTFDQAVKQGTSLKGCSKRAIGLIDSVYVSDSEGNSDNVRPGTPIYLVFQAAEATDFPVIGPLAAMPTERQLQALRGKRICVLSE